MAATAPTINILSSPLRFMPVHSEEGLWFEVACNGFNNTQFKYVWKVYELGLIGLGISNYLGTYKRPPDLNGRSRFSAHKAVQTQVRNHSNNLSILGTPAAAQPELGPIAKFKVDFGWEFNPEVSFTSITSTTIGFNNYATLNFSGSTDFAVNDQIMIDKDIKIWNSNYDGYHFVIQVNSPTSIVIDVPFVSVPITESGDVISWLRMIPNNTPNEHFVYDGTRQPEEFDRDFEGTYLVKSVQTFGWVTYRDTGFLTNYDTPPWRIDHPRKVRPKEIFYNQPEVLSYLTDYANYPVKGMYVITYDDRYPDPAGIINTYQFPLWYQYQWEFYHRWDVSCGPFELMLLGNVNFTNVKYYVVSLSALPNVYLPRATAVRKLIVPCPTTTYKNVCVRWLNKHGGWDMFNFSKDDKKTYNIQKNTFRNLSGDKVFSVQSNETHTLNSDWVDDYTAEWLNELFESPEVYILPADGIYGSGQTAGLNHFYLLDDVVNGGRVTRIIVQQEPYEVKTYNRNKLFSVVLNYKVAKDRLSQTQ